MGLMPEPMWRSMAGLPPAPLAGTDETPLLPWNDLPGLWRTMAGLGVGLELSRAVMTVQVRRQPRGKCSLCNLRRVRYRIAAAMALGSGETDARCGPCWGLSS